MHRVSSSNPPTESAAPGELCNMGVVLPLCYETSVKLRTKTHPTCLVQVAFCLDLVHIFGSRNMMCEVLFYSLYHSLYLLFSQQTPMKNASSKQGLSWTSHTLSHVSTLCNIAFHQQSEKIQHVDSSRLCAVPNLSKLESLLRSTNMCCLARLQIHDGATIPQIGEPSPLCELICMLCESGWSLTTRTL